ncbi:MAG: S8 family serine peptidase, partial [Candidatus Heimdallarchaeota archaeon]|nr:S8 family serine peptidase [Candidatus Heimdallarchaeota archaeon]MCK4612424.1 S8 family serine peptidase [Candidatus Heimdallarchaeota archaeon]
EAILSLNGPVTPADRLFLKMNDIEVLQEYTIIYALHVKGTAENLLKIRNLGSSLYLEENALGHALLFDVTEDFGVRKVWQSAQGYGYTGDPNTAIAILDTGIDDTHPDSNFNVVYWQDFVGAYATPTDKGEHGTHVASIAASKGASSSTSIIKVQDSGYLHSTDGWWWRYSWFYLSSAQTVTVYYTWEGGGSTYIGFIDSTSTWVAGSANDATSPGVYSYAFTTPGWYAVVYGNGVGAGGHYFSGEVVYNTGWTNPYADNRGAFTGVAPGSNIVCLKVLDDMGIGPTNSLINALQWLEDFGQSYNVTVVNMSIGWPTIVSSIDQAVTKLVREKGIVCVVSAGNDGTSSGGIYSPGSCPDAITVGAVNKASEIAYYSSNGH